MILEWLGQQARLRGQKETWKKLRDTISKYPPLRAVGTLSDDKKTFTASDGIARPAAIFGDPDQVDVGLYSQTGKYLVIHPRPVFMTGRRRKTAGYVLVTQDYKDYFVRKIDDTTLYKVPVNLLPDPTYRHFQNARIPFDPSGLNISAATSENVTDPKGNYIGPKPVNIVKFNALDRHLLIANLTAETDGTTKINWAILKDFALEQNEAEESVVTSSDIQQGNATVESLFPAVPGNCPLYIIPYEQNQSGSAPRLGVPLVPWNPIVSASGSQTCSGTVLLGGTTPTACSRTVSQSTSKSFSNAGTKTYLINFDFIFSMIGSDIRLEMFGHHWNTVLMKLDQSIQTFHTDWTFGATSGGVNNVTTTTYTYSIDGTWKSNIFSMPGIQTSSTDHVNSGIDSLACGGPDVSCDDPPSTDLPGICGGISDQSITYRTFARVGTGLPKSFRLSSMLSETPILEIHDLPVLTPAEFDPTSPNNTSPFPKSAFVDPDNNSASEMAVYTFPTSSLWWRVPNLFDWSSKEQAGAAGVKFHAYDDLEGYLKSQFSEWSLTLGAKTVDTDSFLGYENASVFRVSQFTHSNEGGSHLTTGRTIEGDPITSPENIADFAIYG